MKITYNKYIKTPDSLNIINHLVLNEKITNFLKEIDCIQNTYFFEENNFYFFIYPDKGGKIDCSLT